MMERRLGPWSGAGRCGLPSQEFQSGNSIVNPHDEIPTFETWDHLTYFSLDEVGGRCAGRPKTGGYPTR
jgi:hypothetical protein